MEEQMREEFHGRLRRIQERMREHDLVALYLPLGPNFAYVSGVSLGPTSHVAARFFAAIVPANASPALVVPARRRAYVERNTWVEDIVTWSFPAAPWPIVLETLRRLGITAGRLGVDARTSWEDWARITGGLPDLEIMDVSPLLADLRFTKTSWELERLEKAGTVAGLAVSAGLAAVRAGALESDVAAEMFRALMAEEADVFQVAVISGVHRGFPERCERKAIEAGEPVMLFPKFQHGGYYVDITRMAVAGAPSDEQERIERALIEAHTAAVAEAGPGVPFQAVDAAAREVLDQYGLAKYLTHGIGHGVGLETHEAPYVDDEAILRPGTVFTIEPSVYLPRGPAFRVEDTFIVTDSGVRHLTPLNLRFHRADNDRV